MVLDLAPLTQEQQNHAISQQLQDNVFYDHLRRFAETRTRQDDLYRGMDHGGVERIARVDLTRLHGGGFDPTQRQMNVDGEVLALTRPGRCQSATLRRLDTEVRTEAGGPLFSALESLLTLRP